MRLSIVKIGNSKGIRLNKFLMEKYNIKDNVDLILEKDHIILKSMNTPRKGWDEAFKMMNENNDDKLLIDDVFPDEIDDL
jgi:antitoxin MazE